MKLPHKTLERKLFASGYSLIFGVDEVGMGCLAGPVVVCAVSVTREFYTKLSNKLSNLRESKLLLPHQREKFASELLKNKYLKFKICYCYPKTIDKLNIYQAARQAMRRAVKKLTRAPLVGKTIVLVDGPNKIKGLNMKQMPIVKGDRKIFAIACASIIAKVYRDKLMTKYAEKYPKYGFEIHKGYGTKLHYSKLRKHGPCDIHRKSFRLTH